MFYGILELFRWFSDDIIFQGMSESIAHSGGALNMQRFGDWDTITVSHGNVNNSLQTFRKQRFMGMERDRTERTKPKSMPHEHSNVIWRPEERIHWKSQRNFSLLLSEPIIQSSVVNFINSD